MRRRTAGLTLLTLAVAVVMGPTAKAGTATATAPYQDGYGGGTLSRNPMGTDTAAFQATADAATGRIRVVSQASDTLPVGTCCYAGTLSSMAEGWGSIRHEIPVDGPGRHKIEVDLDVDEMSAEWRKSAPDLAPVDGDDAGRHAEGEVFLSLEVSYVPCLYVCRASSYKELLRCEEGEQIDDCPGEAGLRTLSAIIQTSDSGGAVAVTVTLTAAARVGGPRTALSTVEARVTRVVATPLAF